MFVDRDEYYLERNGGADPAARNAAAGRAEILVVVPRHDGSQSALLTGQWNFPAFSAADRRRPGLVGNRVVGRGRDQHASRLATIGPLMAAFNAIAWMAATPVAAQPGIIWI